MTVQSIVDMSNIGVNIFNDIVFKKDFANDLYYLILKKLAKELNSNYEMKIKIRITEEER